MAPLTHSKLRGKVFPKAPTLVVVPHRFTMIARLQTPVLVHVWPKLSYPIQLLKPTTGAKVKLPETEVMTEVKFRSVAKGHTQTETFQISWPMTHGPWHGFWRT